MGTRGLNSPYSHVLVLSPTAPKTSGGSLELVDGQIALTKEKSGTATGQLVVPNLSGASKKDEFKIQVGTGRKSEAGNISNKNFATVPFTKDEVMDVTYSAAMAPTYASVTLGYNGVAGTGFALKEKQATTVSLSLTGDALAYLGYGDARADLQFSIFAGNPDDCVNCAEPCSSVSCKDITSNLVQRIRNHELRPGSSAGTGASVKVSDIIDVIPTFSCAPVKTPTATATYYTLTINDGGTQEDLAVVAQNYPTEVVNRLSREGIVSVYEILTTGSSPAAFSPLASNKLLLDCDCPVNYTAAVGGFVYSIELDDAGADVSATLLDGILGVSDQDGAIYTLENLGAADVSRSAGTYTAVASTASGSGVGATFTVVVNGSGAVTTLTLVAEGSGYIVGETITIADAVLGGGGGAAFTFDVATLATAATSVTKANNDTNIGTYVVAFESELDATQIAAIKAVNDTYTVTFEGQAESICVPDSQPADTSWVSGDTCTVSTQQYYIDLKDTVCGDSRLVELQENYPNLTITEDTTTEHTNCRRRYLTTVTSNIVCEGCETPEYIFEAPIDFSFESWKVVAIQDGGLTSYSSTLSVAATGMTTTPQSVTLVTGGTGITYTGAGTGGVITIAGSTATKADLITLTTSGTGYEVGETVTINLATALGFSETGTLVLTITGVSGAFPTDCECGITFKAKESSLCPPAMLVNNGADYNSILASTPKGVKIQVSAGEAPTRLLEGYKFVTTPFKVTYDTRHFEGTGWGISFMKAESEQYQRFLGVSHPKNYAEGYLMGFETKLEPCAQYDTVTVKIHRSRYSGTQSRTVEEDIRYIFVFDSGRLCEYKDFFNALGGDFTCPA